jgi:hypothetical protein
MPGVPNTSAESGIIEPSSEELGKLQSKFRARQGGTSKAYTHRKPLCFMHCSQNGIVVSENAFFLLLVGFRL